MTELIRDRALRSLPSARIRHGRLPRPRWWRSVLAVVAAGLSVVLVSGTALASIVTWRFASNIEEDVLVDADGNVRAIPTVGDWPGGFNVMISAVDNAEGQFDAGERDATLNDANLLVHVAEDQQSAVVISIPRDLVVPIPACPREDGEGSYSAMSAQQFNVTYGYGGMNCVVLTAENLTGLTIDYSATISLEGVAAMSTAVGGVDICITEPLYDRYTGLDLPNAGINTIEGFQAMQFLRTRYGVGDGSDFSRIGSQQQYMASLIRKLQDGGTLTNPAALYGIAQVATENMRLSSGLTSLDTMVSMARVLAEIPRENIVFVQYPATTNGAGRAIPVEADADALFEKIRNGERFTLADDPTGNGTEIVPDPNAEPTPEPAPSSEAGGETPAPAPSGSAAPTDPGASPTPSAPEELDFARGQTAADNTCSVVR